MPDPQPAGRARDKSATQVVEELWALLKTYARQETVDPLRNLGRFVGFGLGGMVLVGLGGTILALALLRAIQAETDPHWTGNWSWIPYAITLVLTSVAAYLAYKAISRKGRGDARDKANVRTGGDRR